MLNYLHPIFWRGWLVLKGPYGPQWYPVRVVSETPNQCHVTPDNRGHQIRLARHRVLKPGQAALVPKSAVGRRQG